MASIDGSAGMVLIDAELTALPNDNFVDATTTEFAVDSTAGATREAGEPQSVNGTVGAASVWYRYLAPATMPVQSVTVRFGGKGRVGLGRVRLGSSGRWGLGHTVTVSQRGGGGSHLIFPVCSCRIGAE